MKARLSARSVRNVIGAIITAAAIVVLFVTGMGESWTTYRHTVVPEAVVPKGQSGEAAGRTWRVDAIRHLNRSPADYGPRLPSGTVLTAVTVDRSGIPPADVICNGVITDGKRRWKSEGVGGFRAPEPDGVTSLCSKPGRLQFTFLLPRGAVPAAMDVTTFDGQITVRLLL
jgi:hypothetical protein